MSKLVQLNVTGTTNGMDGKFSFSKGIFESVALADNRPDVGIKVSCLDEVTNLVFETRALAEEFYNEVIRQMEED